MRYLIRIVILVTLALYFTACESGDDSKTQSAAAPKKEITIVGQEKLEELEDGLYVGQNGTHPTLFGDLMDVVGNTYVRVHWDSGVMIKEEGTISFRQDYREYNYDDPMDVYQEYTNYIVYQPTSYTPSNCGYSFDSYEEVYEYESNGDILTQWVHFDDVMWVQSVGYPHTVSWADANLTAGCL